MTRVVSGPSAAVVLAVVPAVVLAVLLGACTGGSSVEPITLDLQELNGSGVSGTVTMTAIDDQRTLVEVSVDPAGHPSMPAHIHPGSCANLVPQPRYPLENIVDGESSTEVAASLAELQSGGQALNLHASNEQMDIYSACVDLS